jgi:hypothetical protein
MNNKQSVLAIEVFALMLACLFFAAVGYNARACPADDSAFAYCIGVLFVIGHRGGPLALAVGLVFVAPLAIGAYAIASTAARRLSPMTATRCCAVLIVPVIVSGALGYLCAYAVNATHSCRFDL